MYGVCIFSGCLSLCPAATVLTLIDGHVERVAVLQTKAEFLQYLYLQDSDETPSTINRKSSSKKEQITTSSTKKEIQVYLGPELSSTVAATQTQSKILQSSQAYSMLFKQGETFFTISGESINWLQLLERMDVYHSTS